jgi:hypothetical protein
LLPRALGRPSASRDSPEGMLRSSIVTLALFACEEQKQPPWWSFFFEFQRPQRPLVCGRRDPPPLSCENALLLEDFARMLPFTRYGDARRSPRHPSEWYCGGRAEDGRGTADRACEVSRTQPAKVDGSGRIEHSVTVEPSACRSVGCDGGMHGDVQRRLSFPGLAPHEPLSVHAFTSSQGGANDSRGDWMIQRGMAIAEGQRPGCLENVEAAPMASVAMAVGFPGGGRCF